jgi:ankyrin repeat protein
MNKDGWTALHHAVSVDRMDAVAFLVTYGADTSVCDAHGRAPLHLAVERQSREALCRLVEAGAAVDLVGVGGRTARHMCAEARDMGRASLRGGACEVEVDAHGWRALGVRVA